MLGQHESGRAGRSDLPVRTGCVGSHAALGRLL